jgi:xanthine dehydrogenase accessory factor
MHEFYDKIPELIRSHPKLALATIVQAKGSTPRGVGAKMVVFPDGMIYGTLGGGKIEHMVTTDAQEAIRRGESMLKDYSLLEEDKGGIGAICGGEVKVFIEVIKQSERLLILGGGHIALALYRMALEAEFSVVVVDERPEFVSKERFPQAELLLNCPPDDYKIKELVDRDTYIIVATHGHKHDKAALKNLIDCDYKYLGMIGSRRKVKQTLAELAAEGVSEEKLDKLYSPIGLDIKAETPAEIAISFLAELVHVRRTNEPSKISLVKLRKEINDKK